MIDTTTQKPLRVSTAGTARPYIALLVSQLDEVRQLLEKHHVRHVVDDLAVSIDGAPERAIIDLDRGADVNAVQAILDSAS